MVPAKLNQIHPEQPMWYCMYDDGCTTLFDFVKKNLSNNNSDNHT